MLDGVTRGWSADGMRPRSRPTVDGRVSPVAGLIGLLAPQRCLACGVRAEPPWCQQCDAEVVVLPPGCPRCAAPRGPGHPCWPPHAPIAGTVAVFDYRGPVAAAVVSAKVAGARSGWPPLAARLAARVALSPPPVDAVTWVTTPASRRRQRGLDHAELLARRVAVAIGVPPMPTVTAVAQRRGDDRFAAALQLPGTQLLLVDDVLTTGRTAAQVATVLRAAGAGDIHLAVLARAGAHPLVAGPAPPRSRSADQT